jgi:hypothetical protein
MPAEAFATQNNSFREGRNAGSSESCRTYARAFASPFPHDVAGSFCFWLFWLLSFVGSWFSATTSFVDSFVYIVSRKKGGLPFYKN